mmetsp:Transcript_60736/g.162568  ORF Transcript_60736/g.162568 Transcript_60736/m.162568 type:complete len:317 (-) Transcript_60736:1262-2212(-)
MVEVVEAAAEPLPLEGWAHSRLPHELAVQGGAPDAAVREEDQGPGRHSGRAREAPRRQGRHDGAPVVGRHLLQGDVQGVACEGDLHVDLQHVSAVLAGGVVALDGACRGRDVVVHRDLDRPVDHPQSGRGLFAVRSHPADGPQHGADGGLLPLPLRTLPRGDPGRLQARQGHRYLHGQLWPRGGPQRLDLVHHLPPLPHLPRRGKLVYGLEWGYIWRGHGARRHDRDALRPGFRPRLLHLRYSSRCQRSAWITGLVQVWNLPGQWLAPHCDLARRLRLHGPCDLPAVEVHARGRHHMGVGAVPRAGHAEPLERSYR